jgi:ribosomal protein L33
VLKKNKQLIIGFVLGALIFGIIPVGAVVQDYILKKSETKLMVDGKEFANKELPVLIYKGYNYIPAATFREICDTIEVGFEWIGEKNEIQINTGKNVSISPVVEERKIQGMNTVENIDDMRSEKKDGYNILIVDGIEYIHSREVFETSNRRYTFNVNNESTPDKMQLILFDQHTEKEIMTIPQEEIHILHNRTYFKFDYFLKDLVPLINQ